MFSHSIRSHNFYFIEGSVYQWFFHKLKQSFHNDIQDRKLSGDRYVVTVFAEDRITVRVINIDINK